MEAIAKTKYLKGSPRKARLVIDLIRGVNVSRALSILKFTDKRAAQPIAQCLNSAIANATYKAEQDNIAIDPDDLWIKTCFVDIGPTKGRRRMRPAPQGRAYREQRHYCHITIQLTSEEKVKTEQELELEEAMAERIAARKAENAKKKKAAPKKETKRAKTEEKPAEEVAAAEAVEETVETQAAETIETEAASDAAAVEETAETGAADAVEETAEETVETTEAASESETKTSEEAEKE